MSQIDEASAGGAGTETLTRAGPAPRRADRPSDERPDYVWRHPASLVSAPPSVVLEQYRLPTLAVAGLLLLTAAAVLEGYRWLHLIPASRLYPPAWVFAVLTVPLSLYLTRSPDGIGRQPTRSLVAVASGGLVAATVLELVVGRAWSAYLLGAYDLTLAAILLTAALIGGKIPAR